MFFGLKKGTSAPYLIAIFAYLTESVLTIVLCTNFDLIECKIEWAKRGLPLKYLIFLCLILFDPLLAGIIAKIFTINCINACLAPDRGVNLR